MVSNTRIILNGGAFNGFFHFRGFINCKSEEFFFHFCPFLFYIKHPRNTKGMDSSITKVDSDGTPLCPLTQEPFLPDGSCKGKTRSFRLKYICPKSIRVGSNFKCLCETPCKPTKSTVTCYKYPHKDFRLYPGIQRCSQEWEETYKHRATIERTLASLKRILLLRHQGLLIPQACAPTYTWLQLQSSSLLLSLMLSTNPST